MGKISRNAPCHCGSGKKYKKCCLAKDNEQRREHNQSLSNGLKPLTSEVKALDEVSNSVLDLIDARKLDEAENVCRVLLEQYPEQVDWIERSAMLYEVRGDYTNAALYYRKTAEFMRSNPGFDEKAIKWALEQAERIDKISESDAEQTH